MNGFQKKIEMLANIAIVIVATLLCVVLVKNYLTAGAARGDAPPPSAKSQIQKGNTVNLPDADWQKNGKTLLLVLSTTCHFCTESGRFYQRLAKGAKGARLTAVMPQSVEDGRRYLKGLGVEPDDVRQAALSSLGVDGTPTLILVDDKGVIVNTWVGKLPPDGEREVLLELE